MMSGPSTSSIFQLTTAHLDHYKLWGLPDDIHNSLGTGTTHFGAASTAGLLALAASTYLPVPSPFIRHAAANVSLMNSHPC